MGDICLDFRKAFDVISRSILASKLGHSGLQEQRRLDGGALRAVRWAHHLPVQEELLQGLGVGERGAMDG